MKTTRTTFIGIFTLILFFAAVFTGCNEGNTEQAKQNAGHVAATDAQKTDNAIENAGQAIEQGAEKVAAKIDVSDVINDISNLVNTQTVELGGIKNIDISFIAEDIAIHEHDKNEIVLKEYMSEDNEDLYANVEADGETLTINHGRRTGLENFKSRVEIFLPKTYNHNLDISTISGKIHSDVPYKFNTLIAESTSGEISLDKVVASTMRLTTVSGKIDVNEKNDEHQKVATKFNVMTTSGDINVKNAFGSGKFHSTSGNVNVDLIGLQNEIASSSVAGNVVMKIPEKSAFKFTMETTTGKIEAPYSENIAVTGKNAVGNLGESASAAIDLFTTTGNIQLEKR